MPAILCVRDESMSPDGEDHLFELEFPTESITVRELIRERVYQEVGDYNRSAREHASLRYRGLVTPTAGETELNKREPRPAREIDWKRQVEIATLGYERRQFLVLVGTHQTESLDEVIRITRGTEVTFLRLVPLVGG